MGGVIVFIIFILFLIGVTVFAVYKNVKNKCIYSHEWEKWEDKEEGSITNLSTKASTGICITQERRCKRCNKVELRLEKTDVRL